MAPPLELPVLQRWSCHNCGGCCRRHLIEITDEERQRILSQGWENDPALAKTQTVVPLSRWPVKWRLNHRPDGSCVFLDENRLCRIHAKHGETAKPLACRVYPYAIHPAGKGVTVSLRYSCPSVVANQGATAQEAEKEIRRIVKEVVPRQRSDQEPPPVSSGNRLDQADFRRMIDALDDSFANPNNGFLRNLLGTVFWMSLVSQASFEKIRGGRLVEFLSLIRPAAAAEVPADLGEFVLPSRPGQLMFRMLVYQYARLETVSDLDHPWQARWRNVSGSIRFSRGKGKLPPLREELKPVPFETLEKPFGWPSAADELFTRYFRTKIRGLHFCGPAFYDFSLVEGFFSLALMVPSSMYLARWIAAGEGRDVVSDDDVRRALAMADHHHGYSPALGDGASRRRVKALAQGDLPKLCVKYSR